MRLPVVLLVAGVLLFVVSLTADITTIGEGTGIGWKQITGAVIGVVIAAIGIVRLRRDD
jgi:hypothetical protein